MTARVQLAAMERVAAIALTACPAQSGSGDVLVVVEPRDPRGARVGAPVPVDIFASGPGADALAGAADDTLPHAGTPARKVAGIARGGRLTVRLEPVEADVTLTATVPPPHARPILRWPVSSVRLPLHGNGMSEPGAAGTRTQQGDAGWNVVTLNAHFGTPPHSEFDPARGRQALAELEPDVVLLQEMDDNRSRSGGVDLTARWAEELGMTGVFGPNLIDVSHVDPGRPAWYGNAILTRGRVVEVSNVALPRLGHRGRFSEPRGLLTAVVDTPFGRRTVLCMHLELDPVERILQGWAIRTAVREAGSGFAVLGGDLNTTPRRPDFRQLARTPGLYDAWDAAGQGRGDTHPAHRPRRRIDAIFPSGRLRTARVEVSPTVASDHLAVRAVLHARAR